MLTLLIVIFVVAYAAIALEHPIRVNKSASALLAAGLLWIVYAVMGGDHQQVDRDLTESLAATAQVVFFLMGAMTIVEVVDAHDGFEVISARMRTSRQPSLMWLVGGVTFFVSAVFDNLTTTIVMISLIRKLIADDEDRLFFAGMVVIAANAGGAWSPIGDVTTTMLWIGGQITALSIIEAVFVPAAISLLVPLLVTSYTLRGKVVAPPAAPRRGTGSAASEFEKRLMFWLGVGCLVSVPAFKTVTHLPPFLGILFGLGALWLVGEIVHRGKEEEHKRHLTLVHALRNIDMSSVVFFIGILLSVAVLEHTHILAALAGWLDQAIGRLDVIVVVIGLVSAVVDNVPLVAATMGMYSLEQHPPDSFLWEFVAYCAGTGGSILIIGSAAGVAAMGLERIQFLWYARRIGGLALAGYLAGALAYVVQYRLQHG
jgi:Na+/H+ antiporter NhaD/arsenite permease-like protein